MVSNAEYHHFHLPHNYHYRNRLQNDNPLLKPGLQSVLISFCTMIVFNNENNATTSM